MVPPKEQNDAAITCELVAGGMSSCVPNVDERHMDGEPSALANLGIKTHVVAGRQISEEVVELPAENGRALLFTGVGTWLAHAAAKL